MNSQSQGRLLVVENAAQAALHERSGLPARTISPSFAMSAARPANSRARTRVSTGHGRRARAAGPEGGAVTAVTGIISSGDAGLRSIA
jgi:hypothetical protein